MHERAETAPRDGGWVRAALGAVLALSLAACLRKIWAADFWWQYAAGRYVSDHGWPSLDVFSYTAADRPWMELRWLFCVVQYQVGEGLGIWALIALKWLAVVAAFVLVAAPVARPRTRLALAAVWTVALLASSQRFYVRPELVSYLLIGLFVFVLRGYSHREPRSLFALPLLQLAWVNAHPLFIFGPLLVGLSGCADGLRWLTRPAERARLGPRLRTTAVALAGCALACLVNPWGLDGALHPFLLFSEMRGSVFSAFIDELKSPFAFGSGMIAVVWYEALIGVAVLSALANFRRLDPFWGIFCLSQLYLSTLSIRNLPFFALAAVPFVVDNLDRSGWLERLDGAGRARLVRRALAGIVVTTCALYGWLMATDRISVRQNDSNRFGVGIAEHRYPVDAADFIVGHGLDERVYATFLESAYLVSRDVKVFADPRLEVYGEEIFRRYLAAQSGADGWRAAVRRYGIRTALVELRSGLTRFLLRQPDWKLVYFDSVAAVFVTDPSPLPAIANPAAFSRVVADLRAELPPPPAYEEVGVFRRVAIPKPYLAVGEFLVAAGQPVEAAEWLADARRAGPFLPGLAANQARLAEAAGDWEAATRHAEAALADDPTDAGMMALLGEAQFRQGNADAARRWLTRSLDRLPERAESWHLLGRLAVDRQDSAEAERRFAKAVELEPQSATFQADLARLHAARGRPADALAGLERALSLDPRDVTILRDLAWLHQKKGSIAAARAYVERGLQLDPNHPDLLQLRATLSGG